MSELSTNSNCLQYVSLVTTLLAVVMDFYAKQMAFTMGNAFLKTRVSMLVLPCCRPSPTNLKVFVVGIVLTGIPRYPDRLLTLVSDVYLGASATARV